MYSFIVLTSRVLGSSLVIIMVLLLTMHQMVYIELKSLQLSSTNECTIFWNQGDWDAELTQWRIRRTEAAQRNLASLLSFVGPPPEHTPVHLLFAGDSTMSRLYTAVHKQITQSWHTDGLTIKDASRCDVVEYFGLARADAWMPPDLSIEGPCAYGLKHSFCTDCRGCNAHKRKVVRPAAQDPGEVTYEYVPIEFARDREFQTPSTKTTQETLGVYLSSLDYAHDLCVASAGIHDIMLHNLTANRFASNVVDYIALIGPHCKKIVWLLPSASLDGPPQTNDGLVEFGEAVKAVCTRVGKHTLLFDLWDMSLPRELHVDNVHHGRTYYDELGRLILASGIVYNAPGAGNVPTGWKRE